MSQLPSVHPKSPGMAGQSGEPRQYEVRWPTGERFDSRRRVNDDQARLLIEGKICDGVYSPSGILRYLQMRRNPSASQFATIVAAASITTNHRANTWQHKASARKGL